MVEKVEKLGKIAQLTQEAVKGVKGTERGELLSLHYGGAAYHVSSHEKYGDEAHHAYDDYTILKECNFDLGEF